MFSKDIKLAIFHPNIWHKHGHYNYKNQCSHSKLITVNDYNNISNLNYVVVHQDIDDKFKIPNGIKATIYIPGEDQSVFPHYPIDFLNQFDYIFTNRKDLNHHRIINTFYLHPWQVQKPKWELESIERLDKTKNLSAIISSSTATIGHRIRFAFINKLKGHFKDNLEWFNKHENLIENKWDGLAPYKYSIAIENSCHHGYFTEKISDCFLSYTMPIYYGAPDIKDYFDERSFIKIDINDWQGAIQIIEDAIREDWYKVNYSYIKESRRLVLENYNFVSGVFNFINSIDENLTHLSKKVIYPQSKFLKKSLMSRAFGRTKQYLCK